MTAVLPDRPLEQVRRDLSHRRPLVVSSLGAGLVAAGGPLLVLLALGVTGWFLTDAGVHGEPRDGLRVGALGWLMAHASGVSVSGVAVTIVPLGITMACAWAVWQTATRLGAAIADHGPDAGRIADGERDWTVPTASAFFGVSYLGVTLVTHRLAGGADVTPSLGRAFAVGALLCLVLGAPGIATGSGRAAVFLASVPRSVTASLAAARTTLTTLTVAFLGCFTIALIVDFDTAMNLISQIGADTAGTVLLVAVCLVLVPNAGAFSGAYLFGSGFTVGVGTLVSPVEVSVGALPLFPLLAALPDPGPTPAWTPWLIAVPPVVGALGAVRAQRRRPTLRYDEGALHGCAGGMLAALAFTCVAAVAGGAAGPGRMTEVGPLIGPLLVHSMTALGLGGLVGGLLITWWHRRGSAEAS
jgi:hypothetical protein